MPVTVVASLDETPPGPHAVTIGNFDGVHRGHQALLARTVAAARERGARSLVVTFEPLPLYVLRPEAAPKRLTTNQERIAALAAYGIDDIVVLRFDRALAELSAHEFVACLVEGAHPVEVVVGEDFAFGHNRAGTPDLLRELGERYGFAVTVVGRVADPDGEISSTRIRRMLAEGSVADAARLLGRPFALSGVVVHGARRGRLLGYPTANLALPPEHAVPADGIYAAKAAIGDSSALWPAMVYVGTRPTFDDPARIVEVNLLDFAGDLYGARLTVLFVEQIRGDRRFDSAEALIEQMRRDEAETRRVLAALPVDWPSGPAQAILAMAEGGPSRDR